MTDGVGGGPFEFVCEGVVGGDLDSQTTHNPDPGLPALPRAVEE